MWLPLLLLLLPCAPPPAAPLPALPVQGDNNYGDDRLLYARGQEWLHMNHIMGRAVG